MGQAGRERASGDGPRAYEGDKTRRLVEALGMMPVAPPKANRKVKWDYDRERYKLRNEVEPLFPKTQGLPTLLHAVRQA